MKITAMIWNGRQGWKLENDRLALFVMAGGGHLAGLWHQDRPAVNPFWRPIWKSVEPWHYQRRDDRRYGVKLLACIAGHNLCLHAFGDPSPEEARAGLMCHAEAPVVRWRVIRRKRTARRLEFSYGCDLPIARMTFVRTIRMAAGSAIIRISEKITNLARCDVPFTMCQHVTFGPPFVERGVTAFDMPATKGHTIWAGFGKPQRLKPFTPFTWPDAPGVKGKIELRYVGREKYSDFSTHLMDPKQAHAWFSAVNPRLGLLVAYVWSRQDYPWLGMWEEAGGRKTPPWNGKSLTRGMEFANSPFPVGLRRAVDMGKFHGQPTYRWLPAQTSVTYHYAILAQPVESTCKGVAAIHPGRKGFCLDLMA